MIINSDELVKFSFTQEQFKIINKLLPYKYSFVIVPKNKSKNNTKKKFIKNDGLKELTLNNKINTKIDFKIKDTKHKFINKALNIIETIKKNRNVIHFLFPVDVELYNLNDYHNIIKNPMDLKTVENNLKLRVYDNLYDFDYDMKWIFSNAKLYNKNGSYIYQYAKELKKKYLNLFKKEFDENLVNHKIKENIENDYSFKCNNNFKFFNHNEKRNLIKWINYINIDEISGAWEIIAEEIDEINDNKIDFNKLSTNKLFKLKKYVIKKKDIKKMNKNIFNINQSKELKDESSVIKNKNLSLKFT